LLFHDSVSGICYLEKEIKALILKLLRLQIGAQLIE